MHPFSQFPPRRAPATAALVACVLVAVAGESAGARAAEGPPSGETVRLEIQAHGDARAGDGANRVTEVWVRDRQLLVQPPEAEVRLLFDGEEQTVHVLNTRARSHAELSAGTLELVASALHRQLAAAAAELEQQLERVPSERREPIEARLREQLERLEALDGAGDRPRLVARGTGRRERVAGVECEWHELVRDGRTTRELCVAPWAGLGVDAERLQGTRDLGSFSERLLAGLPGDAGVSGLDGPFVGWQAVEGLPLRIRLGAEDGSRSELTVRWELVDDVDPARFEIPSGFTRTGVLRVD